MVIETKEKRNSPRIKLNVPLHYQIRGTPEIDDTITNDVGLGGIGIISNKFIASQTTIMIKINVLSHILSPIGRIAWSVSFPHSDKYRLGIEFLELNPQEKNYLADYIDMQRGEL